MKHEPIKPARVMTATEFKAKCLEVMDRVNAGEWSQVVITKRGKEVAVVRPPAPEDIDTPWDPMRVFGCMEGSVTIPEGVDIVGPIYDPALDGPIHAEKGVWKPA